MNYLASFLLILCGIAIGITFSILVMIHGWGLKPVSYVWIIGIGLLAQITSVLMVDVGRRIAKDNGNS